MSWLKRVHEESEKVPEWLWGVLRHPEFVSLSRDLADKEDPSSEYWWINSTADIEIDGDSLREACDKFLAHFGARR